MNAIGLVMLAAAALLIILTGLPVFVVLIGISCFFVTFGIVVGVFDVSLLFVMPFRVLALLESDILQAIPLYLLMGSLLNRLPLIDILFRAARRFGVPASACTFLFGALLGPMNGSVGASVTILSRVLGPRLKGAGIGAARRVAVTTVAGTIGVVTPPSLVLILLGDAMLTAHTVALNANGGTTRVLNTQDLFRGAIVPAAAFVIACIAISLRPPGPKGVDTTRNPAGEADHGRGRPVTATEWLIAIGTLAFVVGLLALVTSGFVYAVEAAAFGVVVLLSVGVSTRLLKADDMRVVVAETFVTSGALFALLLAATSFTLIFRAFETDVLLTRTIVGFGGSDIVALAGALAVVFLMAIVLDAYECIFLLVPLLAPPILMRIDDAVWVSILILLILQTSFILPPFGYGLMLARSSADESVKDRAVWQQLAPFLVTQLCIFGLVVAFPAAVHLLDPAGNAARSLKTLTPEEVRRSLQQLVLPPEANP